MTEILRIHRSGKNLSGGLPDDQAEEVNPKEVSVVIVFVPQKKKSGFCSDWNFSPNNSFGWDGDL